MPESLIIRCPVCGTNNRVPQSKLGNGSAPVCGNCKTRLPLTAKPLTITDANFPAEVEQSPVPVLLDLWAPWCGPCQMIAPVIDQVASETAGRLRVGKLNVDDNPITANRFHVRGIPCLLILQGGREVDRIVGVQPKSEIMRRVNQVTWAAATAAGGKKA
jgi:thioredoxin